jgi:Tc toxin complex TcA C-terminal TcB-binding domain/Neuraminidase-like domain/Putative peptidoglycan binding domain
MVLTVATAPLSLGLQGDDVARLQRALQTLGRNVPLAETQANLFGPSTTAVLKALQADLGMPATGVVDAATVAAINRVLADRVTDQRTVRGRVTDADGNPAKGPFVQLFLQQPAGEQLIGTSTLDADGAYQITYSLPADVTGPRFPVTVPRADLRVEVCEGFAAVETVETTPPGSSVLTDADLLEVVDFAIGGAKHPPSSDFQRLSADLQPVLGGRDPGQLQEDAQTHEASLLAVQSGHSPAEVAALAISSRLAGESNLPAPLFYALQREGLPADLAALKATHPDAQLAALKAAVAKGTVSQVIDGVDLETALAGLTTKPDPSLTNRLGGVLKPEEVDAFWGKYLEAGDDPAGFWLKVAADPAFGDRAGRLKLTVQLTGLTDGNDALVAAVLGRGDIAEASDLARLTEADWRALVAAPTIGVPADIPGETPEEKTSTYVGKILGRVEAAFATQVFAARLGDTPIASFLLANVQATPPYDLKTTYPPQFFKQNPAAAGVLQSEDQARLQTFQRLYRLTGNAAETLGLSAGPAKDLTSAAAIARLSPQAFADRAKDVLTPERAQAVHAKALQVNALALALFGEHAAAMNRSSLPALPRLDTARQAAIAAEGSIPDWRTLFGAFDLCACADCASVHSPAAYLVDILDYLDEARGPLFGRRPDLGEIELSCENTDTPLPMVDLVNEILEDTVSPPAPFTAFDLAPALEADLAQTVATTALGAAFDPVLAAGTKVEALEPGLRWRVWDEAFAYTVTKSASGLGVATRSRQTGGTPAERRATPQYRNGAAYAELAGSVFPWSLPFDIASAEAETFLTHLGVPRQDLIEALRPAPEPFDPASPVALGLAAEGLGLTDAERRIIAGDPLNPPQTPESFWNGAQVADLAKVRALLDHTGLGYADLEAVLATRFVDPTGAVTISPDADAIDSCDVETLHTDGLTADILDRLHRFIRLWRKLGWAISDLDRTICLLSPDSTAPLLTDQVLVRLDHLRGLCARLRLAVKPALAFWRPIDTAEPSSLYESLFYNPAVFKPQDEAFRLRADLRELVHIDQSLTDHAAALQAAFRLDAVGFAALLVKTDGALDLANLSLVFRHATLARQLRLSVPDLLIALDLIGLDPFSLDHTDEAGRFVEAVSAIQASGFDLPRLDYLLRHRFSTATPFVPTDPSLSQILGDIGASVRNAAGATPAEVVLKQQQAVIDRVVAALGVTAALTDSLLRGVMHTGESALQRLLETVEVDPAQPLSRTNAAPQFETLEKLLKVAGVIQTLALPASQLPWLFAENPWLAVAPDPLTDPTLQVNWFSLIELQGVRRDLALGDAAVEALLGALTAVAMASDPPAQVAAKNAFAEALSTWLGWSASDLETLIGKLDQPGDPGLLAAHFPDGYGVRLLVRLNRAITAVQRSGATVAVASTWCDATVTPGAAKALRDAAKAKYDDDAWQAVAVPSQDALRDRQRQALIDYLVARPDKWSSGVVTADADDLYAHFLIDVQMCSCQLTSRIKQAIGSVQLFVQRCLMGLESQSQPTDPGWSRWKAWMKNYRVWEANRKIWLYPENWIEPELRGDKTPFFKDLESELLQSDIDNDAAEQALMHYLEKLDQVAHLEIAGTFEDEDKTLHVFGRTFHTPRTHFYRRRDGATLAWTPWEKVDLDIAADHLIPVVWNRKLMLIWPIFNQAQDRQAVVMPASGEAIGSKPKHWEMQLAWSEFRYGRWTGRNLTDAVRLVAQLGQPGVQFGDPTPLPAITTIMARPTGNLPPPPPPSPTPNPPAGSANSGSTAGDDAEPEPVPPYMVSFKTIVPDPGADPSAPLIVRGYLRLDYDGTDATVAYPFGEFRFSGCHKIVSAAHRRQLQGKDFALAPQNTQFAANWFDQSAGALTMLDGAFVSQPATAPGTFADLFNLPSPLPQDASATIAERIGIPVLGGAPSAYRLLAPHQDPQFIGDRPFFYMDTQRVFVVSSTGSSWLMTDPLKWVAGDLSALGVSSYPPVAAMAAAGAPDEATGLTVMEPGPGGTRIARQLPAINLNPVSQTLATRTRFWSDRAYTFQNFHHPYVCAFVENLDRDGIGALLSNTSQSQADPNSFAVYTPTSYVAQAYPCDDVEFQTGAAYDTYNWELFFHVPLLMATRLSANQRFEEAQRWFHYIFDPTAAGAAADVPQAYWLTKPFHDRLSGDYEQQSVEAIETLAAEGAPPDLNVAISLWRDNPFDPFAVARLRTTAFQKTVVMKYVDNLIAWGDQLFGADTIETINEATQLYVLAAEILGRRPEVIEPKAHAPVETFNSLAARLGPLGDALEQIELLTSPPGGGGGGGVPPPDAPRVLYFCVQENDQLLARWSTVVDRLFKIRHCMNIQGQVQQLPLFEPPIDPALLVRAQAAGLSLADVLSDSAIPRPNYRFSVMLQKANDVAAEVRNLGAELLSVLEKRDAEALSTLRSGQELQLLQAMRDVRARQVDEAGANIDALEKGYEMAQARQTYYESRQFMNAEESASVALTSGTLDLVSSIATDRYLAGVLANLGAFKLGGPTTVGEEIGFDYTAHSLEVVAGALDAEVTQSNILSQLAGRQGEYQRRQDEWTFQADLAGNELEQIDKQLTAAQIRLAVAQGELDNHDRQIANAGATDEFLRGKFTNQDLYQWMIGQVSGLYFQSYQLAYDLAKRAERCLQHELGMPYGGTSIVQFGDWDSLKKGLLAGHRLAFDLKRLEVAYLDGNAREYELTKHVSLTALAPEQLIALKETGACQFDVPEWLFDLDTPGHYRRILRMVGVTIPCVIGAYTAIHCKVQLVKSAYRQSTDLSAGYDRLPAGDPNGPDTRFIDDHGIMDAIVTSTAQNDSGLFEPSLRDERYLPFEGAGAISTWRLELSSEFRIFDYDTITDVVLHLRYTARDDATLRDAAVASINTVLADTTAHPLVRLFSLRHEFPNEWRRFKNTPASALTAITVDLATARFPYFAQARQITIVEAKVLGRAKSGPPPPFAIAPGPAPPTLGDPNWTGLENPGPWTIGTSSDPSTIDDVFAILYYTTE